MAARPGVARYLRLTLGSFLSEIGVRSFSVTLGYGDEKFVNKMSAMAEQSPQGASVGRSRLEIPHAQRRPVPLALQNYMEQHPSNRNAAIKAAFATGNYTMARLAAHFKLHYTSVSRIVKLA